MKKLPEAFLNSLTGVEGIDIERFVSVHQSGEQVTSIRVNPAKPAIVNEQTTGASQHLPLTILEPVPWTAFGFYLARRPSFTFDPLFHAGCYYVQEASSMFLEQALRQLSDLSQPLKVLDLCAAPGGKSTHIQSLLSPGSLLVSNEFIRQRSVVLIDNIVKWGSANVIVTNNDPSAFKNLEGYFDVMVVDAPCSGSGLFRKDEDAIEEWSLYNVQLCSQRQQKLLADALPALKESGLLVYSTCSYSREEDEAIADWLVEESGMENLPLNIHEQWKIVETTSPVHGAKGYRFYPDKLKGEGFYLSCFKKTMSTGKPKYRPAKIDKASNREKEIIQPWIKKDDVEIIRSNEKYFLLPSALVDDYAVLRSVLNIQYEGTVLGSVMKNRLVPEHSFALSLSLSPGTPAIDLSYEQAIKYLQRQEMDIPVPAEKGWRLVRYRNRDLGWVNVLPNRINNYYPKELRILKQQADQNSLEQY